MIFNRLLGPAAVARTVTRPLARQQQRRLATKGPDNEFLRERLHAEEHAAKSADLWKKISLYFALPAMVVAGANAYWLWNEHWEHWAHMPALEDRVEYPYQNIRTKNYPWGNGDKTLFWNSGVNYHNHDKQK